MRPAHCTRASRHLFLKVNCCTSACFGSFPNKNLRTAAPCCHQPPSLHLDTKCIFPRSSTDGSELRAICRHRANFDTCNRLCGRCMGKLEQRHERRAYPVPHQFSLSHAYRCSTASLGRLPRFFFLLVSCLSRLPSSEVSSATSACLRFWLPSPD